jgi:uncharacterized protein YkwD
MVWTPQAPAGAAPEAAAARDWTRPQARYRPLIAWAAWSSSPAPIDESDLDPLERSALRRCGAAETGLREAARILAARKARGLPAAELEEVAFVQRAAGEPHPWPRVWIASAAALDASSAMPKLDAWLSASPGALRRCGVASGAALDGARILVVVAVDGLADLAPLRTRARTGQWLTVEAHLNVAARGGQVLVLGPSGVPRRALTSFDGATLRARFAPEGPGEHTVQVVADVEGGPRPVLEASVFADTEPPQHPVQHPAPGEDAFGADDDQRLARMLDTARAGAGLAPLARDTRLDAVARSHAVLMATRHELAHDAGDGDPLERLRRAGVDPHDVAENVAHAATPALAHRAQWWSVSHRANMLRPATDRFGVAVVRDERGDAWVVELFAGLP